MIQRHNLVVLLMFNLAFNALGIAGEKNSTKWCDSTNLSGQLIKGKHQHEGNGSWFDIFLLKLTQPLTVNTGTYNGEELETISNVEEIQIKDDEAKLK